MHTKSSKVISHNRHHRVVGVDASRGVYLLSQSLRGVPHPIHVQKLTLSGNSASMCEHSNCLDGKKVAARSLMPSFECDHVQSVAYVHSFLPLLTRQDASLDDLVK